MNLAKTKFLLKRYLPTWIVGYLALVIGYSILRWPIGVFLYIVTNFTNPSDVGAGAAPFVASLDAVVYFPIYTVFNLVVGITTPSGFINLVAIFLATAAAGLFISLVIQFIVGIYRKLMLLLS
jgi:hypothetical protein